MTTAGSEHLRVRFSAFLAGGSVGLLLGASCVGMMAAAGGFLTALRTTTLAITAGALVLYGFGFVVTLPVLIWTRRRLKSDRSRDFAGAIATLLALLVAAVITDTISHSQGLTAQIIFFAGLVCAAPALLLARFFTRHRRPAIAVLCVTASLALVGAVIIATQ